MLILAPNGVVIELDALLKDEYKADVEVTKLPVEKRGKISDNASNEPYELEMEGLITDAEVSGSSTTVYQQLNDLRGQLVTLVAGYDSYDNMCLTQLRIPRDNRTGASLRFHATFRHVDQVTLQQTTVAVRKTTTTGGKKSKGPQSTTPTQQRLESKWHKTFQQGPNPLVPLTSGSP